MPAICSTFFGVRAATMPAPRGAGIRRTSTLPHSPVSLVGTVCTLPILFPLQKQDAHSRKVSHGGRIYTCI